MKKIFTALSIASSILLLGMGPGVTITNDTFKNAVIIKTEIEKGSNEMPGSLRGKFTFIREIKKNIAGPAEINFTLDMSSQFSDLERKFYIGTDSGNQDMAIQEFKSEARTHKDRLLTSQRKVFRIKVIIPKQFEDTIIKSNQLVMRVYVGTQTATYTMSKSQLEKIKQFLTTREVK
jgi:hypothetical protein